MTIELSTPKGRVFTAVAASIDVRTENGSVHINPSDGNYLNMIRATEITILTGNDRCVFMLENAVAGLKGDQFTVLAERIQRVAPPATNEPGN